MVINRWLSNFVSSVVCVLTGLYIFAYCYGAYKGYSPVPFGDTWQLFDFLMKDNKTLLDWFAQHNEHRIFLERVIGFVVYSFFGGSNSVFISINFFLFIILGCVLYLFGTYMFDDVVCDKIVLACLVALVIFSTVQQSNMVWEFQAQFILAYLLPLLSAFFLYKAYIKIQIQKQSHVEVFFSLVFAFLMPLNMANGVLFLPFYCLLAFFVVQNKIYFAAISVSSVLYAAAILLTFHSPEHHSTLAQTLLSTPGDFIKYMYVYLGSPFEPFFGLNGAYFAGMLLLGLALVHGVKWAGYSGNKWYLLTIFLSIFFYIVISAASTAAGRLNFGIKQAHDSRYTTPALVALVCVLFLIVKLSIPKKYVSFAFTSFLVAAFLVCFPYQLNFLNNTPSLELNAAGLAAAFVIQDDAVLKRVFYSPKDMIRISNLMKARNVSFMTLPPYASGDMLSNISELPAQAKEVNATIHTNTILMSDKHYASIDGLVSNDFLSQTVPYLLIATGQNRVVGIVVLTPVQGIAFPTPKNKVISWKFVGYVRSEYSSEMHTLKFFEVIS